MTEYTDTIASKTRRKQEMQDLQAVGLTLMDLKPAQQQRLPLDGPLRTALEDARRISNVDARRRHALFVGRLIDDGDADTLLDALAALTDPVRQQRLQQWTDQVIHADDLKAINPIIEQILGYYPHGDRQALRNQARNLFKARPADPDAADAAQRERLKRERKRFVSLLNEMEKNTPLY